jgi:hypothetical protein
MQTFPSGEPRGKVARSVRPCRSPSSTGIRLTRARWLPSPAACPVLVIAPRCGAAPPPSPASRTRGALRSSGPGAVHRRRVGPDATCGLGAHDRPAQRFTGRHDVPGPPAKTRQRAAPRPPSVRRSWPATRLPAACSTKVQQLPIVDQLPARYVRTAWRRRCGIGCAEHGPRDQAHKVSAAPRRMDQCETCLKKYLPRDE